MDDSITILLLLVYKGSINGYGYGYGCGYAYAYAYRYGYGYGYGHDRIDSYMTMAMHMPLCQQH